MLLFLLAAMTAIVQPNELARSLHFTDKNDLWNIQLAQRISSEAALEGIWIASCNQENEDDDSKTSVGGDSVAHVEISRQGPAGIRLFCRDPSNDEALAAAMEVLSTAIKYIQEDMAKKDQGGPINPLIVVGFGSLDRRLIPDLRAWLESNYSIERAWEHPCGMWDFHGDSSTVSGSSDAVQDAQDLPPNGRLRLLTEDDAPLVNARWEYSSEDSLPMIQKMIALSESTFGGCMGLEVDNTLVAWNCRYLDGSIGMLWTEEAHRKRGYGRLVVNAAVKSILERRCVSPSASNIPIDGDTISAKLPLFSYTVDTNNISQDLLTKLNWQRVADADWVGFTLLPKDKARPSL